MKVSLRWVRDLLFIVYLLGRRNYLTFTLHVLLFFVFFWNLYEAGRFFDVRNVTEFSAIGESERAFGNRGCRGLFQNDIGNILLIEFTSVAEQFHAAIVMTVNKEKRFRVQGERSYGFATLIFC